MSEPFPRPSELRERLVFENPDGEPTHLALRLAAPSAHRGDGLAVLYLHGFGSSQDGEKATFFRQRMVDAGLSVASIDFQGHGESGGSLFDITVSRNLDDIGRALAFLRARGFERFLLFGSSMGAASGLWYATTHADTGIECAIHIAPALDMEARLTEAVGEQGLRRWQRDGRITLSNEHNPVEVSWQLMADLAAYPTHRLAERYAVPTLIFQGRHDTSVSWRAVLDFAAACVHDVIELHWLGGGDHRLLAHKDHLWRMTRSFLATRGLLRGEPRSEAVNTAP